MISACASCGSSFQIRTVDQDFYAMMQVPLPKTCPDCRNVRRLAERNSRNLYWRTSSLSGERILSHYHQDHSFPVYSPKEWWSDAWDGANFGRTFDFGKPFFEQFAALKNIAPHQARFVIEQTLENSEYTNCTGYIRNCYLVSECDHDEDCYYSARLYNSKTVMDCFNCHGNESCYECIDCNQCHYLCFSQDCHECSEGAFLRNCISCEQCTGCINQRHKRYMFRSEQLTKDEYLERVSALYLHTTNGIRSFQEKIQQDFLQHPRRATEGQHNENSIGDHIDQTKNAYCCMDCNDVEDCAFCQRVSMGVKSSMDYTFWGDRAERIYMCAACGDSVYNLRFCTTCTTNMADCTYCDQATGLKNCFGCCGLKRKQYCILNKQYSKIDYETLVPQIIEHMKKTDEWGEFFPKSMVQFAYNETLAQEVSPLTKKEALAQGWKWRDVADDPPDVERIIPGKQLPDTIDTVPDDILNWAIECEITKRPFRIVKPELAFYRKMRLPLPHFHPTERHRRRMEQRNPAKLWKRKCGKCGKEMETTYSPERPEIVYCERCYLAEVY